MTDREKIEETVHALAETARAYEKSAAKYPGIRTADQYNGKAEGISYAVRVMAEVMGIDIGSVLDSEDVMVKI